MGSDDKILDDEASNEHHLAELKTKLAQTEKPIKYATYLLIFIAVAQTILVLLGKQIENYEFKPWDDFSDFDLYDFQFPMLYLIAILNLNWNPIIGISIGLVVFLFQKFVLEFNILSIVQILVVGFFLLKGLMAAILRFRILSETKRLNKTNFQC